MPAAFKPSRSRILSVLILFLFLFLTYRYVFPPRLINENQSNLGTLHQDVINEDSLTPDSIKPVRVTVFYECLCPDSRSFFLHHLVPAYEKAPNLVDIEYVPYGNAKTFIEKGEYKFTCQHGPTECFGNKIHACAVKKIKDPRLQLKMTTCMIDDNMAPAERGAECSAFNGVEWKPILDCALSKEGDLLLKEHGDATQALQPPVSFIPTILLNQSQGDQRAILKNLWKEICKQYPKDLQPKECLS